MQKLTDLSIFKQRRNLPKPVPSQIIHIGNHPIWNENFYLESPDMEVHNMALYCPFLVRSEANSFFQERRIKQNFLSIEYIYSGEFYFRNDDRGYRAEKGDICLLQPGQDHDLLLDTNSSCKKMGIIISGSILPLTLHALHLDKTDILHLPNSNQIDELFDRLRDTILNGISPHGREKNAALCMELLQMLSNINQVPPIPPEISSILEYLEQHCSHDISMHDVASIYGMSLPSLNKHFSNVIGKTPYQYLIQIRMHRAEYLLLENDKSIKEIAATVGYNSALHFSNEFRRLHGCSPRQYKNLKTEHQTLSSSKQK